MFLYWLTLFYFLLELFWTAPEFLGEGDGVRCSQQGDVYSYGIILSELLSREEPYSSLCMDPKGEYAIMNNWFKRALQYQ